MKNPFDTTDRVDQRILQTAVPVIGGVALTAAGVGVLKACCGVRARKFPALPIGMAVLTAGVAVWAYLNPEAIPDRIRS